MHKLYYTVENILQEVASLITHTQNMPKVIIEFYEELQELSLKLDAALEQARLTPEEGANELTDVYQDMIDVYVKHLELEAEALDCAK